jgi:hypothetical protein
MPPDTQRWSSQPLLEAVGLEPHVGTHPGARTGGLRLEVVEVSPRRDTSDITALLGVRVTVEALGSPGAHGKLDSHKALLDKPVRIDIGHAPRSRGSTPPRHATCAGLSTVPFVRRRDMLCRKPAPACGSSRRDPKR